MATLAFAAAFAAFFARGCHHPAGKPFPAAFFFYFPCGTKSPFRVMEQEVATP